jgi:hypothetical protein
MRPVEPQRVAILTAAAAVLPQERYARQEVARTLRRVFQGIDTKSDGKIDEQELGSYLSRMRYKPKKVGLRGTSCLLALRRWPAGCAPPTQQAHFAPL